MRILDRYVITRFLNFFFLALAAFSGVYLLVDFIEKLDNFIDNDAPWSLCLLFFPVFDFIAHGKRQTNANCRSNDADQELHPPGFAFFSIVFLIHIYGYLYHAKITIFRQEKQ